MIGRLRTQTTEASKFIVDWMEHRTGIVTITEHFLFEPVPKRGAWLYSLGSAVLFTITLQFLTGILLLFYYVPTTDHAWNSVNYIMTEAYFGQLIRGIHYWSANFLMGGCGAGSRHAIALLRAPRLAAPGRHSAVDRRPPLSPSAPRRVRQRVRVHRAARPSGRGGAGRGGR